MARAEPAQPEVPLASSRYDPLHRLHRLGRQQPRAVHLAAAKVEQDEPGGLVDATDQPAVGGPRDVEGVEGDVPALARTNHAAWQRGPQERGEGLPQGLVAGGRTVPRGLREGEAGAVHPEGNEYLLAHVVLVPYAGDLGDHLPEHQVAEVG